MKKIEVVFAATRKNGIGFEGSLPWPFLQQDMKWFKDLTTKIVDPETEKQGVTRNAIIMGRKTWHSLPGKNRTLPHRLNVVISHQSEELNQQHLGNTNLIFFPSFEAACLSLSKNPEIGRWFVIGGASLINEAFSSVNCEIIYLTQILKEFQCDTFSPPIDLNIFELETIGEVILDNSIPFQRLVYKRKSKLFSSESVPQIEKQDKEKEHDSKSGIQTEIQKQKQNAKRKNNSSDQQDSKSKTKLQKSQTSATTTTITTTSATSETLFFHSAMKKQSDEFQYLNLIQEILMNGETRKDRTGVGVLSTFGQVMRFDLTNNTIPLLTTRLLNFRGIAEELFWMIRGSTNTNELHDKKVFVWDKNGSRENLDKLGLTLNETGDIGPVYGFQWRNFGANYENFQKKRQLQTKKQKSTTKKDKNKEKLGKKKKKEEDEEEETTESKGVDQLMEIIRLIKTEPTSRRIVINAWNPSDLKKMALPPCHILAQFYVHEGKYLSCQMYQRSGDIGLGVPWNIASYSLLTHLIAHVCSLKAHQFIHVLGDAHIYTNHIEQLKEQSTRIPFPFPKLDIDPSCTNIEEIQFKNLTLSDYHHHSALSMQMAL